AVGDRERKLYPQQELFDFPVQGGASDEDEAQLASEGMREQFAGGRFDERVHRGYERDEFYGAAVHAVEYRPAGELFHDLRHGAYDMGTDALQRLDEQLDGGHPAEQREVCARGQ